MAFICTLAPGQPLHLNVLTGNGEFIVRTAVGYDDTSNYVYSTFVTLSPMAGYADTKYDLAFAIIEASTDGAYVEYRSDGLATKGVIVDVEHRQRICMAIGQSVKHLIDVAAPTVVNMVTHSRNLPEKALRKFHQIAAVFAANGYNAGPGDPWHGHHIWLMERVDGTE